MPRKPEADAARMAQGLCRCGKPRKAEHNTRGRAYTRCEECIAKNAAQVARRLANPGIDYRQFNVPSKARGGWGSNTMMGGRKDAQPVQAAGRGSDGTAVLDAGTDGPGDSGHAGVATGPA